MRYALPYPDFLHTDPWEMIPVAACSHLELLQNTALALGIFQGALTVSPLPTQLGAEPVEQVRTLLTLSLTGRQGGRQAGQPPNRLSGEVRDPLLSEGFTA